ncbi:polysaccharide deacetylase family protein [Pseudofrankia inefficax]|uniref:Polysaccharide deacetylase n=1 Tax=Pseudofrankia inefficax (strain DSM 45817 / CECT 9037 / DDB 130130 / EuI1c) TaxID=298654 RepID=E3J0K3_PSEI1|nr:polysaccharide deacetylase family protein [Pseudofrankia inefficax]ADP81632.1 polysaccharide deacetylase [Pseudofrankia inefficax]
MTRRYDYDPITSPSPGSWPGGRRLAVYVAIGVEDYRAGEGHVEDLLPDVPAPDLVNGAWRDYGNRVGVFRLLDRLGSLGIPPTLLLNTQVYDAAPAVTDAARAAGAELVGHGISNSDSLADLPAGQERDYLDAVAGRIEKEEGARPGGWSSPWLTHTPDTIDLLAATGYRYLLDLRADDRPFWLRTTTGPLLSIPYALELNDSSSVIGRHVDASTFADMIVDEFDELLAAGDGPLVMSIVLHSFISGVPFRLRQVTRALAHLAARRDRAWLARPGDIHAAFAALCPPPPATAGGRDG